MTFTPEQIEALDANLDGSVVKERAGFSYIEGWHAVKEANRIFGHGNWNHQVLKMEAVVKTTQGEPNYEGSNGRKGYLVAFIAAVGVQVTSPDGLYKSMHHGVGYGEGIDYNNCGQAYESAVKEAETDAMKRALKNWGNPFGLALYDKDQAQVDRAPSDKGHGICAEHGVPYFQTDKQKKSGFAPSHKQGDGWCSKDDIEDEIADAETLVERTRPAWQTQGYLEAKDTLSQLHADGDARQKYVSNVLGREVYTIEDLQTVTDEEWAKVKESATADLANNAEQTEQLDF